MSAFTKVTTTISVVFHALCGTGIAGFYSQGTGCRLPKPYRLQPSGDHRISVKVFTVVGYSLAPNFVCLRGVEAAGFTCQATGLQATEPYRLQPSDGHRNQVNVCIYM